VADGEPVCIPTLVARVGRRIYVHGSSASRMLRALRHGSPACLTVTLVDGLVLARSAFEHSANLESVVASGRFHAVDEPEERRAALEAFSEKILPGRWSEVRSPSAKEFKATAVLAMGIDEASAKVRSGPPDDDGSADAELDVWAGEIPIVTSYGLPLPALRPGIPHPPEARRPPEHGPRVRKTRGVEMRKLIAAFRVSLDGIVEGPDGDNSWVDTWEDTFDLMPQVDAMVLGGGMYPGYEQCWSAVHADPQGALPFTGRPASAGEVEYARFARKTPHVVVSTTLDTVSWATTRIVREIEEIRAMEEQPGKDIYAVGGPTLISNLMNRGLVDELRLDVHPIVLGGGKALFNRTKAPFPLQLLEAKPIGSGQVRMIYALSPVRA
jgi:nitroimidazol reductase NimA-like FMN-containing flavoprotein (pyridoxamine 5'-phosphate oxidase superfamily)/dihydrofolate reductase